MQDCGVLVPVEGAAEEGWTELLRRPAEDMGRDTDGYPSGGAGERRTQAEKRKREDEDTRDVRAFTRWFEGAQFAEIKRVAGMESSGGAGPAAVVGVGGGVVAKEDFLEGLRKRHFKGGEEGMLAGSVLGTRQRPLEEMDEVVVEGGPVKRVREWRPSVGVGVKEDGGAG